MINLQGYLITAGATAIIAFGIGWKAHSNKVKADNNDALEQAIINHNMQIGILETELKFRQEESFRLSERLDGALQNVRTEYRTIEKEIPKYVPQSTDTCDCSLGSDFVRLFNNASTRNRARPAANKVTPFDISDTMPRSVTDLAGEYP